MRLIDADALVELIKKEQSRFENAGYDEWCNGIYLGLDKAIDEIDDAPPVDAVPVVHGRWESFYLFCDFNGNRVYEHHHLECGFRQRNWAEHLDYNYCPNCGAKMDGDGNGT